MRWEQKVQYAALSDIGLRRKNNQDSLAVQLCSDRDVWQKHGHIFIVADGMGGHAVGELASKMAVDAIPLTYYKSKAEVPTDGLVEAIEHANRAINERGSTNRDFNRMGTTCVVLVLSPHGATFAHVGDSRGYRVRGDRVEQLTFDHSLQWELQRQGRLKKDDVFLSEARHVITRSLGPEPKVEVETDGPLVVLPNDKYLLCSDGLTGYVSDSEIGMILRELPMGEAARLLVNLANMRGGADNITVVAIQCGDAPDAVPDESLDTAAVLGLGSARDWKQWALLIAVLFLSSVAIWLFVFDAPERGIGALLALLLVLVVRRLIRPKAAVIEEGQTETDATVEHRAYRVASARTTKEFLASLSKMEVELRKMAHEETWQIDWEQHAKQITSAKQALDGRQPGRTMSELGKAIDLLMLGLHAHRKKLKQQMAGEGNSSAG